MISIVLVDDHAFVRKGVRAALEVDPGITVVGEAEDFQSAMDVVARTLPDIVLLDLQIPGMSGAELCWRIGQASPATAILILSAFLNPQLLRICLSAGVRGYLLKDTENLDIVSAVRTVAAGGTVLDRRVAGLEQKIFGESRGMFESLTARELQVISLVSQGLTNNEIASELSISLNTVKGYVSEIMRKLGCRNRVEIVTKAREYNLI